MKSLIRFLLRIPTHHWQARVRHVRVDHPKHIYLQLDDILNLNDPRDTLTSCAVHHGRWHKKLNIQPQDVIRFSTMSPSPILARVKQVNLMIRPYTPDPDVKDHKLPSGATCDIPGIYQSLDRHQPASSVIAVFALRGQTMPQIVNEDGEPADTTFQLIRVSQDNQTVWFNEGDTFPYTIGDVLEHATFTRKANTHH